MNEPPAAAEAVLFVDRQLVLLTPEHVVRFELREGRIRPVLFCGEQPVAGAVSLVIRIGGL